MRGRGALRLVILRCTNSARLSRARTGLPAVALVILALATPACSSGGDSRSASREGAATGGPATLYALERNAGHIVVIDGVTGVVKG